MEGRSPGSGGLGGAGLGLGIQSAGRGSYPPVPGVSDDTRDTTYGSDGTALHRFPQLRQHMCLLPKAVCGPDAVTAACVVYERGGSAQQTALLCAVTHFG